MRHAASSWLCAVVLLLVSAATASAGTDKVVLVNGDSFVGDIQSLRQGELLSKTDYIIDVFRIDWTQFSASGSITYVNNLYSVDLMGSSTFDTQSGDSGDITAKGNTADMANAFAVGQEWFTVAVRRAILSRTTTSKVSRGCSTPITGSRRSMSTPGCSSIRLFLRLHFFFGLGGKSLNIFCTAFCAVLMFLSDFDEISSVADPR